MESNDNKQNSNFEAYKAKMQTIFYNLDVKNNICPDCGKIKSMDFASINNGIIICEECAKQHLSLGYNISFIHSLGDKWDDYLFNYIKVGGNTRFIQFCKDYKLDKEGNKNIIEKYKSKGLTYYRDILRSEVLGYDPPENINVNKAFEEEKNIPDNYPEFKKYTFVKHVDMNYSEKKFYTKKEEKNEEGIFGKIGDFFGNVKKNIGIGDWDIVKKVQDFNINDVKQKGVDMFGYFFFGGNSQKKEEEKKDENNQTNDELNKVEQKENIIINNDIKENESKKEIIKDSEDKIEIKEEVNILTNEANENKINDINNNIEKDKNKENNIIKNDINQEKEIQETKENNNNQNAIEDILKDNNFNNDDNSKMNSEEKNELEKMLQE